jgi:hypothetical protein
VVLALTNFKAKIFSQHFSSKAHLDANNTFYCNVIKVENFDKKCLTLSKKNQKSPFKNVRFGMSKSPVKELKH